MATGNENREATENVIPAWKDQEHRPGLGEAERAPISGKVGLGELSDSELEQIAGGDAVQRKHVGD